MARFLFTLLRNNAALAGLVLLIAIGAAASPAFLTAQNISNLLRSTSFVGLIAVGMTFVVLCGSIDISVGPTFAFSGYLFITNLEYGATPAILIPLLAGIGIGLVNGVLINELSIPPFIGTMASMLLVKGIVLFLSNQSTVKGGKLDGFLRMLGRGTVWGFFPMPFVVFFLLLLVCGYLLRMRVVGRNMYVVGGNEEAARMMGVNPKRTRYIAHMLCGLLTAVGGILFASRVGSASPLAGTGYEMYAIAAVVIGGASLSGGIGKMSGTLFGALIMGSFSNIFNLQKIIKPVWQDVIVGGVLLLVIVVQAVMGMPKGRLIQNLFGRTARRGEQS